MKKYNLISIKIVVIISFIFVLLLMTCTKDVYAPSACFQDKILPIFISNCTMSGCHNAKERAADYDLTNYEGIMKGVTPKHPLLSEVYNSISGNNPSMPVDPYPKLSNGDVSLIKLWINAGAKNTVNCASCDTLNYRYNDQIKPIMQTWCVGCHNQSNPGGNIILTDYSGVSNAVTSNRLLGSVQHITGFSAMPKNGSQLSSCQIKVIEKWIANGFLNN